MILYTKTGRKFLFYTLVSAVAIMAEFRDAKGHVMGKRFGEDSVAMYTEYLPLITDCLLDNLRQGNCTDLERLKSAVVLDITKHLDDCADPEWRNLKIKAFRSLTDCLEYIIIE